MSCQCDKARPTKRITKTGIGKLIHFSGRGEDMLFIPLAISKGFTTEAFVHYITLSSEPGVEWRSSWTTPIGFNECHWYTP